ncbi:hypothetical protein [Moraxella lacunata]|uniref:hypothetical protein n=1 Tax=Moraxella lacunata TaxID=477 RepID=UPI003EE02480
MTWGSSICRTSEASCPATFIFSMPSLFNRGITLLMGFSFLFVKIYKINLCHQ